MDSPSVEIVDQEIVRSNCDSLADDTVKTKTNPEMMKSNQPLRRQIGHYKLKIRHQVENIPGKKDHHVTNSRRPQTADVEKPTHSETLTAIKQALEAESLDDKESESTFLATRCLFSSLDESCHGQLEKDTENTIFGHSLEGDLEAGNEVTTTHDVIDSRTSDVEECDFEEDEQMEELVDVQIF